MRGTLAIIRACIGIIGADLRWKWGLLVVLAAIAAALEAIGVGVVVGMIGLISDMGRLAHVPLVGDRLAAYAAASRETAILILGAGVIGFFLFKNAFLYVLVYFQEKIAFDSMSLTAERMLRGYLAAPYPFYFQRNPAELTQDLEVGISDVFRVCLLSAVLAATEILSAGAVIAVLVASSPVIALSTMASLGGLMLLTLKWNHARLIDFSTRLRDSHIQVLKDINQSLGAVKDIKILGRADFFCADFGAHHRSRSTISRGIVLAQASPRLIMEAMVICGMVAVIVTLTLAHNDVVDSLPTLGMFAYAGFRLLPSVSKIASSVGNIHRGAASVTVVDRDWKDVCTWLNAGHEQARPFQFHQTIDIRNLCYTYPGAPHPVLNGVSLVIGHGQSVGIVGATGAGKSTLIDLVLGLLSPQSGMILVDGVDIATNMAGWQRKIGHVPQSIYLTDDTLRRNIAFGIEDERIDDAKVWNALDLAQLSEFVRHLPHGLDSTVGDRGIMLSGGQRQRIGIARALYHQPELLVFDEATSALDAETENDLSQAIDGLNGIKTIILIAHRLGTLRNCSTVVLLKEGRVAASGPFTTLLENESDFRRMAALSAVEPADADEVSGGSRR